MPIAFDLTSKRTYNVRSQKEVSVKTTTGGKMNATMCLTICSKPLKLPPYIIFKNKTAPDMYVENSFQDSIILCQSSTGWIEEKLMKDYLEHMIFNLKLEANE